MRTLRFALPIFMLAYASFSQAEVTEDAYGGIPDEVIANVGKRDIKGMFKAMSKNLIDNNKLDNSNSLLDNFIKQFDEQLDGTGDFLDASRYQEEHYGPRYSVLTYIVNFANKPIGLTIQMYNGQKGWRAINVSFTPEIFKLVTEMRGITRKSNP